LARDVKASPFTLVFWRTRLGESSRKPVSASNHVTGFSVLRRSQVRQAQI
jgi:hypothetical protein